jgi:hypothetical protein
MCGGGDVIILIIWNAVLYLSINAYKSVIIGLHTVH